eukprot:TRINITY_DN4086_c0_g2_i2.p1 TRINITY_DN4086_c0_g2~~TRINITY_DN4086_c0_g2_i2.p1  ORF type:complete len:425 (-),score=74.53 TRINITY_DN4086_c0_g2_i2:708-1982(-)
MSSFPPPEGDGVVDSIYHYLWTKNTQLETCPNVVIPNTVVYKYRQPAYWYYSSSDQQLKMKKKGDMTNQKISDSFAKRKNPSCEVVAYYISTRETEAGIETTTMEYFDEEGLKDFLFSRQKEHNGIIQKFIDPKGKSNAIIRAIWSPKLCLLEQRVTLKPINDGRYDLYQRCVTYEGAEHQSMNAPVRGVYLPSRLQTICDSIVDHCMRTSSQHYRISRMVLNFKLDHNNKLWLLWCSSMRLAADKFALKKPFPVNISGDITVPDKFKDAVFRSANLPSTFFKEKYFICPGSGEIVDSSDSFEISYKTMIASHEEDRRQKVPSLCCSIHLARSTHPSMIESYDYHCIFIDLKGPPPRCRGPAKRTRHCTHPYANLLSPSCVSPILPPLCLSTSQCWLGQRCPQVTSQVTSGVSASFWHLPASCC